MDNVQNAGGNPEASANPEATRKKEPTSTTNDQPLSVDEAVAQLKAKRKTPGEQEKKQEKKSKDDAPEGDDAAEGEASDEEKTDSDDAEEGDSDSDKDDSSDDEGADDAKDKEEGGDDDDDDGDADDTVRIKVNGQFKDVTLDDLVSTYSKAQGLEAKIQAAAEKGKTLDAREQQLNKHHKEAFDHIVDLGKRLNQQIRTDDRYSKETMERLRREQPDEWAARKQELADNMDSIKRVSDLQKHEAKRKDDENKAKAEQYAAAEVKKLTAKYPELKDQKKMDARLGELSEYLTKSYGFSKDEVEGLMRADMWDIAMKAMAYDQSKSNISDLSKKIKSAPKITKPGARAQELSEKATVKHELEQVNARLKKSGNHKDAVEALRLQRKLKATK
jgi:hypothetical protein